MSDNKEVSGAVKEIAREAAMEIDRRSKTLRHKDGSRPRPDEMQRIIESAITRALSGQARDLQVLKSELLNIATADLKQWDAPFKFVRWAQSRANFALSRFSGQEDTEEQRSLGSETPLPQTQNTVTGFEAELKALERSFLGGGSNHYEVRIKQENCDDDDSYDTPEDDTECFCLRCCAIRLTRCLKSNNATNTAEARDLR